MMADGSGPVTPADTSSEASQPVAETLRVRLRRHRALLIITALVVVTALALAWWSTRPSSERLDPEGTGQDGSRAVVRLLQDHGVQVEQMTSTEPVPHTAEDDVTTTVVVTIPGRLDEDEFSALAGSDATLVLIDPGPAVDQLDLPLSAANGPSRVVEPGCAVLAAERAGPARAGATQYESSGSGQSCYDGRMVRSDEGPGGPTIVLGAEPLLNQHLDDDGNAALALGLLGEHPRVVWYTPELRADGDEGLVDLLPTWVIPVTLQLFVAAAAAAIWRARRLGPVVTESLPVVVRATETTEGRARLYRRGHARDHAAAVLRAASSDRLRTALRLPRGADTTVLISAVAERSGRDPSDVAATLAGTAPADDSALVRLADQLDALEREVHQL